MATTSITRIRAAAGGDHRSAVPQRRAGLILAAVGVALAAVTLIANLVAGNTLGTGESTASILPWSFGLTTLALGTIKVGIAVILVGILVRIYMRIRGVKESLPALLAPVDGDRRTPTGDYASAHGPARSTADAPPQLRIHTMAQRMWFPMLAMGVMAVAAGFAVSLGWNATGSTTALAWTQGLQFLGEGMLLGGISFLLGSILAALRSGGGEIQESLGVTVKTLRMPATAKLFVVLMMAGLMVALAQFVVYVTLAGAGSLGTADLAWLGPFRELGLGLLLSGIVLALATIAKALGFQFDRITELVTTGR